MNLQIGTQLNFGGCGKMRFTGKSKRWMFLLWAALALFVLLDAGVLATTPEAELGMELAGGDWLQRIAESAQTKSLLYFGVATTAFIFFYKQNKIMAWLEIHAPF